MFFCYILTSLHEKYFNETYIGFTDDPLHRIRQHNGEIKGGAKFTKRRRPWKLILVISNFPNKIAALKFEWAWQNPFSSNFIKNDIEQQLTIPKMNKKKLKNYYNSLKFKIEVLNILINSKVFERINLNIYTFDNILGNDNDIIITDILKSNITKIINNINYEDFKNIMNKNKNENFLQDNNLNENIDKELLSFEGLNFPDKCLICEEIFNIYDNKKYNEKSGNYSESSEGMMIENNENESNDKDEKNDKKEYIVKCQICKSPFHMICLANYELEKNKDIFNLVPKKADCFVCGKSLIWSDWVKNFTDQYKK